MAKKSASYLLMSCCAGGLAAFSGWMVGDELFSRHGETVIAAPASQDADIYPVANRDTKRDRDAVAAQPVAAPAAAEPAPERANFEQARAELTPEPPRPKPAAKPTKPSRAFLNDTQIAAIKQRLNLDERQEKFWPPVEKALRALTEQIMDYQKRLKKRDDSFDTESAAIRDLKAASKTLLTHLRDEQKAEVLMLARMSGLGSVITELSSAKQVARNAK